MLQKIHDKVSGWFAGFLLALLAVVFIFWGIDFGFGGVNYAAKVNGEKIGIEEVRRAYQNQLNQFQQIYRSDLPEQMRKGLQEELLEQFIRNELLLTRATDLGYAVSTEQVIDAYEHLPAFQMDGKYNKELAERLLRSQGISPAAFVEDQRRAMQATQLQRGIAASAFVTPAELERAQRLQTEEREAAWLVIPAAHFLPRLQPSDTEINTYYAEHKDEYKTPETVSLKYVELKLEDVAKQVQVTDENLRAHYDTVKDRYTQAERRRASHILIQVQDDKAEAAARKKAEELLAKAKAPGANFAQLAKENSQDAGSASKGGDLGWGDRGFYLAPFADALFDMKPDEIRGPVRTEFGYHIIRLDGIEAGKQKSFEEVRAEMEEEYRKAEAEKQFGERQELLANKAFENLDDLDAVAKELGLTVQEIPEFRRDIGGGALSTLPGAREKLLEVAFSENVLNGENSQPVELAPGHIVVVRTSNHRPSEHRPLAEVREQVVAAIKKKQSEAQAQQLAQQSAARLTAGNETWGRLDSELGKKSEGPKFVGRAEGAMPVEVRDALFSLPRPAGKPTYRAIPLGNGDTALLAFSATRIPQKTETPEERIGRARQLAQSTAGNEVASYIAELRREADVVKNPKLFE